MADRKTARKKTGKPVLSDAEEMLALLHAIKERTATVDYAAAMIQPEWKVATEEMEESPHMELILYADVDDIRIYAVIVTDECLRTVPPDAPKVAWSIQLPDQTSANVGGGAADIEQAKHFATLAYQAACGVITSGSA